MASFLVRVGLVGAVGCAVAFAPAVRADNSFFDVEPTFDPVEHKMVMRYAIGGKTTLVGFAILIYGVACGLGGGRC